MTSVVCTAEPLTQIAEALWLVEETRDRLRQESRRLAAEGLATEDDTGSPLLHALTRASRQLVSLRETVRSQANAALDPYWLEERDVAVVTEAGKAQTALLRAQQIANDTYSELLAQLDGASGSENSHYAEALGGIESCDRATVATASAMSSVIDALTGFRTQELRAPGGAGGAAGSRGRNGGQTFPSSPLGPPEAATMPFSPEARAGGQSGVFNRGIHRSASATGRSCRWQATSDRRASAHEAMDRAVFGARGASAAASGSTATSPLPATATEMAMSLGLSPVTRAGNIRRQALVTAETDERRRLMSSASGTGSGSGLGVGFGSGPRARDAPGASKEGAVPGPRNSKLSPREQQAAMTELMSGRSATGPRRRGRGADEGAAATVYRRATGAAAAGAEGGASVAPSPRASFGRPLPHGLGRGNSVFRAPRERERETTRPDARHLAAVENRVMMEALDERVVQAILDDSSLASLLSSAPFSSNSVRARRQSLVQLQSMEALQPTAPQEPPPPPPLRLQRAARLGPRAMPERSSRVARLSGTRAAAGGENSALPGVDDDEAAALRLAHQEQEAQAREDEILAMRLAAREEAGVERRALRRRLHRRSRQSSTRVVLDPATAAAVATGGEVSEAVRALQFQDIDENDFETLLALDEGGGEGGRCCGGGRGLTETAMEAVLRSGKATGVTLQESCAICMADFEEGEEISTLPCDHTFHGGCIRKWLLLRNRCPTDMQPVAPDTP